MKTVLNLTLGGHRRNRVFLDSPPLLLELMEYVDRAVRAVCSEPILLVDDATKAMATRMPGSDNILLSDRERTPVEAEAFVRAETGMKDDEAVFVVSPFLGVISESGLLHFLDQIQGGGRHESAHKVGCNANPFWLNRISRLSRIDSSHYRDRNTTKLPMLTRESPTVINEVWDRCLGPFSITGGQWLPVLFKLDGSLSYFDSSREQDTQPVFLDEPDGPDLPLLYRLPIFDMARHEEACLTTSLTTFRAWQARETEEPVKTAAIAGK